MIACLIQNIIPATILPIYSVGIADLPLSPPKKKLQLLINDTTQARIASHFRGGFVPK